MTVPLAVSGGLQTGVVGDLGLVRTVLRLAGFAGGAFLTGVVVAAVYRWYSRRRIPLGAAGLTGTGVVAVYLQTVGLYEDVLVGEAATVFRPDVVAFNLAALALAAVAAVGGALVGDRTATDLFAVAGVRRLEGRVSRAASIVGRASAVTLPEEIADMEGYAPVDDETKAELAGTTLLFPRRLAGPALRDRIVARVKEDYDIAHVDVDMTEDGDVDYLAIGGRLAGVGPTLAPGTAAVAIRADPAGSASPGDIVQVWDPGPPPERAVTAELRAANGDVATVAVDEAEADRLDATTAYRLVTLPAEPRAERTFSAAFRAADETMGTVTVAAGSELEGARLAELDVTVVAVGPADGPVEAVPARGRTLAAGDTCYLVTRPDELRRLEARSRVAAASDTAEPADTDGRTTG